MHKALLLALLFIAPTLLVAQIPAKVWDKTLGGTGSESKPTVAQLTDGTFVIAGTSDSNAGADKTANRMGTTDYWLVKLDAAGTKLWDKTVGGNGIDNATAVVATADGGFIVAGDSDSNSSGTKTANSKGGSDYWLVKFDADGNQLWDRTIGGSGFDFPRAIINLSDGGLLVVGASSSDASGDKSANGRGGYDYWIVRLTASGVKLWDKTYGGSSGDSPNSVIQLTDGGFAVAGVSSSNSSGDKTENSRGGNDCWILKLDASGNLIWNKTLGGNSYDGAFSIAESSDKGIVFSGNSSSARSGDKTDDPKGRSDYWLVKLSSSGSKVWDKTIGGIEPVNGGFLQPSSDGGWLIAGDTYSGAGADKSESSKGFNDLWLVKTNAVGTKVWDKTIGGPANDFCTYLARTSDGGLVLTGESYSDVGADKSETNRGTPSTPDFWVVKLGAPPCAQLYSVKSGAWNDPRVWSCNRVPVATDSVTVSTEHIVTMPSGNISAASQLKAAGRLVFGTESFLRLGF